MKNKIIVLHAPAFFDGWRPMREEMMQGQECISQDERTDCRKGGKGELMMQLTAI
jgi:hypothetical protein